MIQVYGYIVCIVAIITFLITVSGSIHALIDLSDPESSVSGDIRSEKPRLASFEIYKMDVMAEFKSTDGKVDTTVIPGEVTLRAMYIGPDGSVGQAGSAYSASLRAVSC